MTHKRFANSISGHKMGRELNTFNPSLTLLTSVRFVTLPSANLP
jgi:hypothetical protein